MKISILTTGGRHMENSYRFFANKDCKYYPCHEGQEDFNCLFCYCPFYLKEKCPGRPEFWQKDGKIIKDCTNCTFPHRPESYDVIINWIKKENEKREFSEEIRKKAKPVGQG
jgi:Zn-finger protein